METMKEFYNEETNTFSYEPNSKEFWESILEHKKNQDILTGKVVALSYNGLIVEYNGYRMFMPSQRISLKRINSFEQYLENDIDFVIVDFDPSKESITISHREIELRKMREEHENAVSKIPVGKSYTGIVESIKDYGAFIKIDDNISGLCHISQISHKKVKKVSSVLNVGDEVKVKVIQNNNGKISLSIKALEKQESSEKHEDETNVEYKNVKLPTGEVSTSLGDLLKNFNI